MKLLFGQKQDVRYKAMSTFKQYRNELNLENFSKLEVLLPSILIWRLNLKWPPSQENGIIKILKIEEDPSL